MLHSYEYYVGDHQIGLGLIGFSSFLAGITQCFPCDHHKNSALEVFSPFS